MSRPILGAVAAALVSIAGNATADEIRNPLIESQTWSDLRADVTGDRDLLPGESLFTLDAPFRAHDAATVPIRIVQTDASAERITELSLIVDENPAPIAATFTFGELMGRIDLETRVRVNAYSNVRALATTEDGRTFMTGRFVKASGGCSAPASKDPQVAIDTMGQMKLRHMSGQTAQSGARIEAKLMIRHPNFSGLQRDQVTLLTIPAHFVDEIEVRQGDDLLFRMTGGISISEDPTFQFSYTDNGAETVHVRATDTNGGIFEATFRKAAVDG